MCVFDSPASLGSVIVSTRAAQQVSQRIQLLLGLFLISGSVEWFLMFANKCNCCIGFRGKAKAKARLGSESVALSANRVQDFPFLSTHSLPSVALSANRVQDFPFLSTHSSPCVALSANRVQDPPFLSTHILPSVALSVNLVQDSPFLSTHSLAPYSGERWPLTTHFTGSTAQISSNSSSSDGRAKAEARQGSGFYEIFKF